MEEAIAKAGALIEAMEYIRSFRGRIVVVKLGGSVLDDIALRKKLLTDKDNLVSYLISNLFDIADVSKTAQPDTVNGQLSDVFDIFFYRLCMIEMDMQIQLHNEFATGLKRYFKYACATCFRVERFISLNEQKPPTKQYAQGKLPNDSQHALILDR